MKARKSGSEARVADEDGKQKPVGERTSGRANPPLRAFTPGEAIRQKLRKLEERIGADAFDAESQAMLAEIYDSLEHLDD